MLRKFVVPRKTGFTIKDLSIPVVIRDYRGILFYSNEGLENVKGKFNLPAGVYYIDSGKFSPRLFPVSWKKKNVPAAERVGRPDPSKFNIRFGSTPHKCHIDWDKEEIVFDESFREKPLPQIDFIKFHEYGHRYYADDTKCDLYARNCMINKGYNPSQIFYAQMNSLSSGQLARKQTITKSLLPD